MNGTRSQPRRSPVVETRSAAEALTLAWADGRERQQVISLAASEGRQTTHLRTMPGAKLAVLRRPQGGFAGWAGMDADSDPKCPELFSQYLYPAYRRRGLGALLEHLCWAYLDARGCRTAFMRMEVDGSEDVFKRGHAAGCCRQVFVPVDVRTALAASIAARGPLDIEALPIQVLR
jgi:GNAT superfamily N-acetyltransferase